MCVCGWQNVKSVASCSYEDDLQESVTPGGGDMLIGWDGKLNIIASQPYQSWQLQESKEMGYAALDIHSCIAQLCYDPICLQHSYLLTLLTLELY